MKLSQTVAGLSLILMATGILSLRAADVAPPKSANALSAEVILRQMSDKLGAAQKFSFNVHREIDFGLEGADGLPGDAEMKLTVQRPDKVMARGTNPDGARLLFFDGKQLSLVDAQKKLYTTVPLAGTLHELPAKLAAIYGFMPPVAEFLINDLYQDLVWRAQDITYAGLGTINRGSPGPKSVTCHRIALSGKAVDSELWIGVDDSLPWRWTATVKSGTNNVGITLEFSRWNLQANTKETDFVYSPPKGAWRISMMTVAEMEVASKPSK